MNNDYLTTLSFSFPSGTIKLHLNPFKMPTPIEKLPEIRTANQSLIDAFAVHPGLPAQARALKGKLFCLWDFANRTNAMIESVLNNTVPPDTPGMRGKVPQVPTGEMTEAQRSSLVEDAVSRCLVGPIIEL